MALIANPKCVKAHLARGEVLLALEKHSNTAIQDYDAAVALDPKSAKTVFERAKAQERLKKPKEVVADTTRAIKLDPTLADAYVLRGEAYYALTEYFQDGDYNDKALKDLRKAIELNPKLAKAHAYIGVFHGGDQNAPEALKCFNKAIELDPKNTTYLGYRAMVFSAIHQPQKAIADMTKSIQLAPHSDEYLTRRATLYEETGQYQKAYDDCTKAIQLDPKRFRVRYQRANLAAKMKHYADAIADYTAVINANSLDEDALKLRGDMYMLNGDYKRALADYNESIDLSPDTSPGVYFARATAYEKLGKNALAARDRKKGNAIKSAPAEKKL